MLGECRLTGGTVDRHRQTQTHTHVHTHMYWLYHCTSAWGPNEQLIMNTIMARNRQRSPSDHWTFNWVKHHNLTEYPHRQHACVCTVHRIWILFSLILSCLKWVGKENNIKIIKSVWGAGCRLHVKTNISSCCSVSRMKKSAYLSDTQDPKSSRI